MNNAFMTWLGGRCSTITDLERRGKAAALACDGDACRSLMREKAELLAALDKDGEAYISALPAALQDRARSGLKGFALSAEHALELNSVFYMSALLYRDDHKEGEPDNLEVFRRELLAALERIDVAC